MDTGSHLLFGFTLAGLAHLDPSVAHNPLLLHAVTAGTLIGSHAPDFDSLIRVKGYSSYIRYHRGITHSIPALFIWPAVITAALAPGFGIPEGWNHLYLWTFAAVFLHVFLDALNTYGVQCLHPFLKKWIHLDILAIFEPFLFLLHSFGSVLWLVFGYDPSLVFSWVYAITFGYIGLRFGQHSILVRKVLRTLGQKGICHVVPSFHWFNWRFVLETTNCFYTGKIHHHKVIVEDVYSKPADNPAIRATLAADGVRAFLGFAQRIHVSCIPLQDGYEVRWSDVRFWYDRKLPFGVDVRLDQNMNVVSHTLGWRKKAWDPPFV